MLFSFAIQRVSLGSLPFASNRKPSKLNEVRLLKEMRGLPKAGVEDPEPAVWVFWEGLRGNSEEPIKKGYRRLPFLVLEG